MKHKKKNKIIFALFLTLFIYQFSFAQVSINNITGDKILNTEGYEGIEGKPFFRDEWLPGKVILASGLEYNVEFVRYDLLLDKLFFSDSKQLKVFSFTDPIRAFTINGAIFQNNFPSIGNFNQDTYFQIIVKSKLSLLKKEENNIKERTAVGIPSIRYIKKNTRYYVFDGTKMILIKLDSKSFATALNVKKEDIDKYVEENNLNLKEDSDLKMTFEYFLK